jgi:hypothetical protein
VIQVLPGHAKREGTAVYVEVATVLHEVTSPLDRLPPERARTQQRFVLEFADNFRSHGPAWRATTSLTVATPPRPFAWRLQGSRSSITLSWTN